MNDSYVPASTEKKNRLKQVPVFFLSGFSPKPDFSNMSPDNLTFSHKKFASGKKNSSVKLSPTKINTSQAKRKSPSTINYEETKMVGRKLDFGSIASPKEPKKNEYFLNLLSCADQNSETVENSVFSPEDNNNNDVLLSSPQVKLVDSFIPNKISIFDKNFECKESIGAGDFGEVYRCISRLNGDEVAIKVGKKLSK